MMSKTPIELNKNGKREADIEIMRCRHCGAPSQVKEIDKAKKEVEELTEK